MSADLALVASAALLGLAGAPHCTAMCAAPCAAAIGHGGPRAGWAFHLARAGAYALAGGVAAASVGAMAALAAWSPALRPLWTLLQVAALALGLWLLWQGRQPAWMAAWSRPPAAAGALAGAQGTAAAGGWQRMQGPVRAAAAGSLWVAWPCGLLHSALLVAALTGGAAAGATAMAAFALASAPGLLAGPWVLKRLARAGGSQRLERWAARTAGAVLAAAAGWALTHGLWAQAWAYCFGP